MVEKEAGGMFTGADKKPSSRKIMGFASFIVGIVFSGWALVTFPVERVPVLYDALSFIPGVFFTLMSMYLYKILTEQNIKTFAELAKKDK